jgi:soluble lytic murein transglycosylase-like protein
MLYATRVVRLSLLALLLVVRPAVAPASAELVLLTTGRTLAVTGHDFDGDRVVLHMPSGGQIVAARSLIVRIEPDAAPPPPPTPPPVAMVEAAVPMLPATPFAEIIDTMSVRHGVDASLVTAVIEVESAYRPDARSPKGAMGLMQLMPATARQYAVTDPFDPSANIEAGTKHLRSLLDRYEVTSALAAYNAGEGPVRKFGGVPPYPETRRYVAKILQLVQAGSN